MKRVEAVLILITLLLLRVPVEGKVIRVPADSSTIQKGINGSNAGDTVLVAIGIYSTANNGEGFPINMKSGVVLRSQSGAGSTWILANQNSTVINCLDVDHTTIIAGFRIGKGQSTKGGGIYCDNSSPKIIDNEISGNTAVYGAGVYCQGGSPQIIDNLITNNSISAWEKSGYGGGIYCTGTFCRIVGNTISGNEIKVGGQFPKGFGGGIFCENSSGEIAGNLIHDNSIWGGYNACIWAGGYGAAISCHQCTSLVISQNMVNSNTFQMPASTGYGGGLYCESCFFPSILRNTFEGNGHVSTRGGQSIYGGGIYCKLITFLTVQNNLIIDNTAASGGGIYFKDSFGDSINNNTLDLNSVGGITCNNSAIKMFNNIITNCTQGMGIKDAYNSTLELYYNDVWNNHGGNYGNYPPGIEDTTWGVNYNSVPCDSFYNIIRDPLFSMAPDEKYHLQDGSACINAGDPASPKDPDSTIADIGAFHYQGPTGLVEANETELIPKCELFQNYPNPFNLGTRIQFALPEASRVTIGVYNILGQRIRDVVDKEYPPGVHNVFWDGKDDHGMTAATGIYFYRIEAGDFVDTKKMVMIK